MASLALDFTPEQFATWLGQRGAALARLDLSPAWPAVSVLLSAAAKESFDQSRTPDGTPWLPLKKPSKKRGGASARPLRDTGLLMASYSGAGSHHVEQRGQRLLVWGSNLDRAFWHQFGTRTIPAREQIGFTPALAARIELVVADQAARLLAEG